MAFMTLGDFFKAAPHCQPVNPKPVAFTAVSRERVLPGGHDNPHERQMKATGHGAFIFVNGEDTAKARKDAEMAVRERFADPQTKIPVASEEGDLDLEFTFQLLQRALREYDPDNKISGEPMFPSVKLMRQCIVMREANRLYAAYQKYVAEEHPEAVDQDSFRKAQGSSQGPSAGPPR